MTALVQARRAARTLGALGLLQLALPVDLALTGIALLRRPTRRWSAATAGSQTILVSGGKMTKALTLARAFSRAGHRVVLVEQAKYRWTGHRFSRCVDSFRTVPPPTDPAYADALLRVVLEEGVDVYVPVCSPAASRYDALAAPSLERHGCRVLHADADLVERLDDKEALMALARGIGLPVPDSHRITSPTQVTGFDFAARAAPYVLKSIAYDPVHRLDLTPLPRPSAGETRTLVESKPISPERPWVLQSLLRGQEYCTHSTVVDGRIQVWACCPSSAFQVNYAFADKPAIYAWVQEFVGALRVTGQVSFDFIETEDGRVLPIECNPRTHSAITMFHDHPDLARAYLDRVDEPILPLPGSRPTYWAFHELWRLLRHPRSWRARWRTVCEGTDAVFDWDDPLPFLVLHHVHIPSLLLRSLVAGKDWLRIDFNIGKLVEPAGD